MIWDFVSHINPLEWIGVLVNVNFIVCVLTFSAVRCAGELLHGRGAGLQQAGRCHQSQRETPDCQRVQQLPSNKPLPGFHHVSQTTSHSNIRLNKQ